MLAYAFSSLKSQGIKKLETEEFENIAELFSEILTQGIEYQFRRGFSKNYVLKTESLSTLRGKIEVNESIKRQSFLRRKLTCSFDEFSENIYLNQILKSTVSVLLRSEAVSPPRRKKLRNATELLSDVDSLNVYGIDWKRAERALNRSNITYAPLISICEMTIKGLLQTESKGKTRLSNFLDEQSMHSLYEKFLLNYYRKEHETLNAKPSEINWQCFPNPNQSMLPSMRSDVTLMSERKILILDAKYYKHNTSKRYENSAEKIHSGNLYQIFTYVKNKAIQYSSFEVSGMLLYARTNDEAQPDEEYTMSGNNISVKTLDLNSEFSIIRQKLDQIAESLY